VDYREVVELVRGVSESRQFHLLESIAAAVADALLDRFPLERARVRVRKPEVQLGVPVEHTAASVERSRV
jgi:dihydroneopterin aldolase